MICKKETHTHSQINKRKDTQQQQQQNKENSSKRLKQSTESNENEKKLDEKDNCIIWNEQERNTHDRRKSKMQQLL